MGITIATISVAAGPFRRRSREMADPKVATPEAPPPEVPEVPTMELDEAALEAELDGVTLEEGETFDDAALEAELAAAIDDDDESRGTLLGEDGELAPVKELGANTNQAFINTFISFVGVGVLGLPGGFGHVGAVWGVV